MGARAHGGGGLSRVEVGEAAMRLLVTDWCRDWRGERPQQPLSNRLELDHPKSALVVYLNLANGNYEEACIESDSPQALDTWRGALQGAGGAERVEPDAAMRASCMYRAGYEAYDQGGNWLFVNPMQRPELFEDESEYQRYLAEFALCGVIRGA